MTKTTSALALSFLAAALSVVYVGAAQRGESASRPSGPLTTGRSYKFEQIADGVYYATSTGSMATGSNNVVVVGDDSMMVIDTGTSPAAARAMLEDVKLISTKPVRYVVNTHFHYDHVNGNQVYAGRAEIIGHDYVKYAIENLDVLHREPYVTSQLTNVPNRITALKKQIPETQDPARKATLERQLASAEQGWEALKEVKPTAPTRTYSKRLDLKVGTHEVRLLFLGRGHTNGDTVVYLPKEKIVCTGDLMESGIAYMGDAQFDEWVATLEALKKLDWETDLPGHGTPFHEKALVTAFQSYLTDITRQVTELKKQGVSAEDAAQRVDLTSHQKDFAGIQRPGADLRGVRRLFAWLDERPAR